MKTKYVRCFSSFIFLVLLAIAGGCASTSKQEGMGEYIDDSIITGRVKSAIFAEKTISAAEINVETFKGVVQLSGFVSSKEDRVKAIEVTREVSGVISVKDSIQLK